MQARDENEPEDKSTQVLEKFNFLIEKYHHQDNPLIAPQLITGNDNIPVLTEKVRLRSAKDVHSEFGELSPLRLLLDAALQDASVDLNPDGRQALVRALENRIIVQEKENGDWKN